jgi:hypothetical protein
MYPPYLGTYVWTVSILRWPALETRLGQTEWQNSSPRRDPCHVTRSMTGDFELETCAEEAAVVVATVVAAVVDLISRRVYTSSLLSWIIDFVTN